jgi:hypothetical protein
MALNKSAGTSRLCRESNELADEICTGQVLQPMIFLHNQDPTPTFGQPGDRAVDGSIL